MDITSDSSVMDHCDNIYVFSMYRSAGGTSSLILVDLRSQLVQRCDVKVGVDVSVD